MKKWCTRLISCVLATLMLAALVPFGAGAAQAEGAAEALPEQVYSATQNEPSYEAAASEEHVHTHTHTDAAPADAVHVHAGDDASQADAVHTHIHEAAVPNVTLQESTAKPLLQASVGASADSSADGTSVDAEAKFTVALSSKIRSGGSSVMRLKGGGDYEDDAEATVIAFSKKGFTFVGWFKESDAAYSDCLSNKQSYTFTVTEDVSLVALYDRSSGSQYEVAVVGSRFKINEGVNQKNSAHVSFNAGERIFVSYTDTSMKFLYWENASRNIVSTDKDYSFVLVDNVSLNAIYTPVEQDDTTALVVFRNAYRQILWTHTYSDSNPEPIYYPRTPAKMGYTFLEWQIADANGVPSGVKATEEAIYAAMKGTDEVIVVPVYTAVGDNTYTITVKYVENDSELQPPVTLTGTLGDPQSITAPAIEGKVFNCWKLNGTIVGYDKTYTLMRAVNDDVVLEAVYGESEIDAKTSIGITQYYCSVNGSKYTLSHTMQYFIPDDWTMAQSGFLFTSDETAGKSEETMVITNSGVKNHKTGTTATRLTYTFNLNTAYPDKVFYVRGYMNYKDAAGVLHTEYTPIIAHSYNEINSIRYTVKWINADGTSLGSEDVPFGTVPEYQGKTPVKPADGDTLYTFSGWTPEITAVTADVTFTATYRESQRTYSGPVWNWDGLTAATAAFTADDDASVIKTVEAQITETVTTPATCTASGERTVTAAVEFGGQPYKDEKTAEISPLGHIFGDWTVTTAPTCTEPGEETRTCSRCGATETREVEALGHDLEHHEAQAPTGDNVGWEAYETCSRCDYTTYVEIPKLPKATVTPTEPKTNVPVYAYGSFDSDPVQFVPQLDDVYQFTAVEPETKTAEYYGNWRADYRVTFSKAVSARSFGLYGAYNGYGNAYNIAFLFPADVAADAPVYLLDAAGLGSVTYSDVKNNIKEFICGVFNLDAVNTGTEMTVELVIWEDGKDNATVIASQKYTFGEAAEINCNHIWSEWTVKTAPTCTEKGVETRTCTRCGATETREVAKLPHTPVEAVVENEVAATCTAEGSYDEVVYCSVCGEELSRESKPIEKIAHTSGEAVVENKVEATCTAEGSYEEVVYCSVCGEELSRETKPIEKIAHTSGEAVVENEVAATCTEAGSYEEVVYCSVCGEELSRETKPIEKIAHTSGEAVVENKVEATCTEAGSYDEVVYCSVCHEEISRATETTPALGHDWKTPVWTWTGTTAATASFTCKRDANHTETKTATITSAAGTGENAGYMVYTATVTFDGKTYEDTQKVAQTGVNTFTHSDNLAHTDTYLYRVGNGNTVTLGTLFKVVGDGAPDAANVKIKVEAVENNSSVKGTGTNLETGSTANCAYTRNTSDWTKSTLKFTGEGPVRVTVSEGDGAAYTLNLEVVTGNNYTEGATLGSSASIVLLGNVKLGASSSVNAALSLSNKNLYGNGFEIDATGSNISTKGHGIIALRNSTVDNVIINGPVYSTYSAEHNNDNYASVVVSEGASNLITNSRITGAASPLSVKDTITVRNTVLSGGYFSNVIIRSGHLTLEDVTTVGTGKNLGIIFDPECPATSSVTINGSLTQHNFIASNADVPQGAANSLKNQMFNSNYSKYQFTSGSLKYVNTGIVSLSSNVGEENIIDNRTDKKNYSGQTASMLGKTGYVYTMENTDSAMLETNYTEPEFVPSAQNPYAPVFAWSVPAADNTPAGGDNHCYKDSSNVLQIQFENGGSKTIHVFDYPSLKRYGGSQLIASPAFVFCTNDKDGTELSLRDSTITFNEAGNYTITYLYENVPVYDKDLNQTILANYFKTIPVKVVAKKNAPNGKIIASSNTGTMLYESSGWEGDFLPYADVLSILTITDTNSAGQTYTVLDGTDQAAFLGKISSVVPDSDNKTGFTIYLVNGTSLYIKCAAPYKNGTLVFKKHDNRFYMGGNQAYAKKNSPAGTPRDWNVTKYVYTGENGVPVALTGTFIFSGPTGTTNFTNLTYAKSLIYKLDGGEMPSGVDTYTTSTTVTLPLPTKEGYTFLNWNTVSDGSGTQRKDGTKFTWSNNTILYAIWVKNVEVTFESEGSTVETVSGGAGTSQTLPTATQSMQWLEGWYTEEEGGTKIGSAGDSFTVPQNDTTYYAHWNPKYVVSYNANGGTVSTDSAVYEGAALILPAPANGSKTFEGWYTAASGGTKIGTAGDSYVPTADIELFAQWSDNILVTFNANGGTAGTNSATYDRVHPITLPAATRAGHQFNGWYTAASGGTKAGDAGAGYTPNANIELFAQWTAYTVTYDANSGSVSPASASAGDNGAVTLPTPTRTGYTFNGWYTAASGGTKIANGGASYTPAADITLHAQWTVISYKVTISTSNSSTAVTANGATVSNGGSVAYGSVVKVVLSYSKTDSLTFTIKQGGTDVTRYSDEACTSTTTGTAAGTYYFKMPAGDVTINSSSSCVPSGTMITMADGTQKAVEDLTEDDRVLVFNHETGEFEERGIIFCEADGVDDYRVLNLSFSDGSVTRLIYEHGYFDLDLMQYVYIREDNYTDYIGHRFAKTVPADDGYDIESVTLTDAWVTEEHTGCFSFPSTYCLNFIADGFLSMPGGIDGMFNFFDYDENLKYDEAAMAADIETYGLLDYSYFEEYLTYEEFSAYPAQYLRVALGKGLITEEQLAYLIERYVVEKR